ncbi:MAG: hypothetical protein HY553_02455 [Elusimicrobia bacterium]|nr:hypothetical protein [Elusimicrobiota bacterium]
MSPLWEFLEVLTVGFPYCCFKVLGGLLLGGPVGGALIALGAVDALINAANAASLVVRRRRALQACFFSAVATRLKGDGKSHFGNSLDVLLCCLLVTWVIARGGLGDAPRSHHAVWSACVILNVMWAGLSRFATSLRSLAD